MWGDAFKDLDDEDRQQSLIEQGLIPGTMVSYGRSGGAPVHVWMLPEMTADSFDVMPGTGTIICVDCESDPSNNWLLLFFIAGARQVTCWVPSGLVTRVT